MASLSQTYHDVTKVDRSAFSLSAGLSAAAFVTVPLLLGIVTGQLAALIYTTLGALIITNTEGTKDTPTPLRVMLVAAATESLAFGLGTLAGTTGLAIIPLVGVGVFTGLLLAIYPGYAPAAMQTAIFFAIGARLPGGSVSVVDDRVVFSLLGGLWGMFGVTTHRFVDARRASPKDPGAVPSTPSSSVRSPGSLFQNDAFRHAVIVGVASSIGLSIGLGLGLVRDFWVVVTIIIALRPGLATTVDYTTMIVIGTALGAVMAAAVTLEVTAEYTLWLILFAVAIAFFSTRGTNLAVSQVFLTPFIIILLNVLYPGHWQLAEARILDVLIGGAVALAMVYVLFVRDFLNIVRQKQRHPAQARAAVCAKC